MGFFLLFTVCPSKLLKCVGIFLLIISNQICCMHNNEFDESLGEHRKQDLLLQAQWIVNAGLHADFFACFAHTYEGSKDECDKRYNLCIGIKDSVIGNSAGGKITSGLAELYDCLELEQYMLVNQDYWDLSLVDTHKLISRVIQYDLKKKREVVLELWPKELYEKYPDLAIASFLTQSQLWRKKSKSYINPTYFKQLCGRRDSHQKREYKDCMLAMLMYLHPALKVVLQYIASSEELSKLSHAATYLVKLDKKANLVSSKKYIKNKRLQRKAVKV